MKKRRGGMKAIMIEPRTVIKHMSDCGISFSQRFSFKERLKILFHKTVWFEIYPLEVKWLVTVLGIGLADCGDYTSMYGKVKKNG